ncbi:MAG: hypothetical protein Q7S65_05685 [Nanoarchaeota archaeon]|nr:hypothetical protein [Nanoarchaeota archaeon]
MSLLSLRNEKALAARKAALCGQYIERLAKQESQLHEAFRRGSVSRAEYTQVYHTGLAGKSFAYYYRFYQTELQLQEARIRQLDASLSKETRTWGLIGALLFLVVLGTFALIPDLTGNVVFSLNVAGGAEGWRFTENTSVVWGEPGSVNGVFVTGTYTGEGPARLYLEWDEGGASASKLIFAADAPTRFEQQCVATCRLEGAKGPFRIRAELPSEATLDIVRIEHLTAQLSEFAITPNSANVTFDGTYLSGAFTVSNLRGGSMALAVAGEGAMTPFLTLDSSLLLLSPGESRNVTYSIDFLNANPNVKTKRASGELEQRISVRLLPEGSFTGELPKEEYVLTLLPPPLSQIAPSPSKPMSLWIFTAALCASLLALNLFLWARRRSRKSGQ